MQIFVAIPKLSAIGKLGANFHCVSASQMINRCYQCKGYTENCFLINQWDTTLLERAENDKSAHTTNLYKILKDNKMTLKFIVY